MPSYPDHWRSSTFPAGQGHFPLLGLRSSDAFAFCRWLNEREEDPWTYRLPTPDEAQRLARDHTCASQLPARFGCWTAEKQVFLWLTEDSFSVQEVRCAIEEIFEQDRAQAQTLNQEVVSYLNMALDCSRLLVEKYHLNTVQVLLKRLTAVRDHDCSLKLMGDAAQVLAFLRRDAEALTTALAHALTGASSLAGARGSERALDRVRAFRRALAQAEMLKHALYCSSLFANEW